MATRVQVILDEAERERFRQAARRRGMSLSAWLREAGRERLRQASQRTSLSSPKALEAFFRRCDEREGKAGREPDWEEHRAVLEESRRAGLAGA